MDAIGQDAKDRRVTSGSQKVTRSILEYISKGKCDDKRYYSN
jgi:hypothetical protein